MSEERQSPFTTAGKFLFISIVAIACGGFYWVFTNIFENLPSGSYSIFYLFGPVGIAALLLFFGVAAVLRRNGIAVFVSERAEVEQARDERRKKSTK